MQDYLGSRPRLERESALGSAIIAGGVKMKLLVIWLCGNRSLTKDRASEDRFAHLWIWWRRSPGSPETACLQRWDNKGGGVERST